MSLLNDFMLLPILIFEMHVRDTSRNLAALKETVRKISMKIETDQSTKAYNEYTKDFKTCSSSHATIDRRWHFEQSLGHTLLKYFDGAVGLAQEKGAFYDSSCINRVNLHLQISAANESILIGLKKSIQSQQRAVSKV